MAKPQKVPNEVLSTVRFSYDQNRSEDYSKLHIPSGPSNLHWPEKSGRLTEDLQVVWIWEKSKLLAISLKNGERIGSWKFGAVLKEHNTNINCLTELKGMGPYHNMACVGLRYRDTGGMVCVMAAESSVVYGAISVQAKVTALGMIDSGVSGGQSSPLHAELRQASGLVAVGLAGGRVLLLDLRRNDDEAWPGKDEVRPAEAICCSDGADPTQVAEARKLAARKKGHLAFELKDPTQQKGDLEVTSLLYSPQNASLFVGFNQGFIQIWNLNTLNLEMTSGACNQPITQLLLQQPENDPRNVCYLWAVQSGGKEQRGKEGFAIARLYSLVYLTKENMENYGFLYQMLDTISPVFMLELSSESRSPMGSQCLSLYNVGSSSSPKDGVESEEAGATNNNSLCMFAWESWDHSKATEHWCAVFDLNRWYQNEMPTTASLRFNAPECHYMASSDISDKVQDSQFTPMLDIRVKNSSIQRYTSFYNPEEACFPSALSFDLVCVHDEKMRVIHHPGVQNFTLQWIEELPPEGMMSPDDLFDACIAAGLKPYGWDPVEAAISNTEKIKVILTVALEHCRVGFLTRCAQGWASGRFSSRGCTLLLLFEWAWQKATTIKALLNQLEVPLYDGSGIMLEKQAFLLLISCCCQLGNLETLFYNILDNCALTIEMTQEIQQRAQVITMMENYVTVELWSYDMGLLPENGNSIPYPMQELHSQYNKRREEIEGPFVLMIDYLIEKCGCKLKELWEREGGLGTYPPPSVRALCLTYLLDSIPSDLKHCMFIYFLFDLAAHLSNDAATAEQIARLVAFPSTFLSPSLIKMMQAIWHLDHDGCETCVTMLKTPLITDNDLLPWKSQIIQRLLSLKEKEKALQFIRARHACMDTYEAMKFEMTILLENELVDEGLYHQRRIRTQLVECDVLEVFLKKCNQAGFMKQLTLLTLDTVEQAAVVEFLEQNNKELGVMFLLLKNMFIEAYQESECVDLSTTVKVLLNLFNNNLPKISVNLAQLCKNNFCGWNSKEPKQPLSVFIAQSFQSFSNDAQFTSNSLRAAVLGVRLTDHQSFVIDSPNARNITKRKLASNVPAVGSPFFLPTSYVSGTTSLQYPREKTEYEQEISPFKKTRLVRPDSPFRPLHISSPEAMKLLSSPHIKRKTNTPKLRLLIDSPQTSPHSILKSPLKKQLPSTYYQASSSFQGPCINSLMSSNLIDPQDSPKQLRFDLPVRSNDNNITNAGNELNTSSACSQVGISDSPRSCKVSSRRPLYSSPSTRVLRSQSNFKANAPEPILEESDSVSPVVHERASASDQLSELFPCENRNSEAGIQFSKLYAESCAQICMTMAAHRNRLLCSSSIKEDDENEENSSDGVSGMSESVLSNEKEDRLMEVDILSSDESDETESAETFMSNQNYSDDENVEHFNVQEYQDDSNQDSVQEEEQDDESEEMTNDSSDEEAILIHRGLTYVSPSTANTSDSKEMQPVVVTLISSDSEESESSMNFTFTSTDDSLVFLTQIPIPQRLHSMNSHSSEEKEEIDILTTEDNEVDSRDCNEDNKIDVACETQLAKETSSVEEAEVLNDLENAVTGKEDSEIDGTSASHESGDVANLGVEETAVLEKHSLSLDSDSSEDSGRVPPFDVFLRRREELKRKLDSTNSNADKPLNTSDNFIHSIQVTTTNGCYINESSNASKTSKFYLSSGSESEHIKPDFPAQASSPETINLTSPVSAAIVISIPKSSESNPDSTPPVEPDTLLMPSPVLKVSQQLKKNESNAFESAINTFQSAYTTSNTTQATYEEITISSDSSPILNSFEPNHDSFTPSIEPDTLLMPSPVLKVSQQSPTNTFPVAYSTSDTTQSMCEVIVISIDSSASSANSKNSKQAMKVQDNSGITDDNGKEPTPTEVSISSNSTPSQSSGGNEADDERSEESDAPVIVSETPEDKNLTTSGENIEDLVSSKDNNLTAELKVPGKLTLSSTTPYVPSHPDSVWSLSENKANQPGKSPAQSLSQNVIPEINANKKEVKKFPNNSTLILAKDTDESAQSSDADSASSKSKANKRGILDWVKSCEKNIKKSFVPRVIPETSTSESDVDGKNEKESSNVVKALYSGDSTLPCMSSDPDSSYENPSQVKSGEKKAELGPRETESNTSQSDNDSKNEKESSNVVKALYSGDSTLPCMSSDPDSSYENPSQVKSGEKKAELGPRETESNTSQSDNDSKNEKESSNVVKALYSGDSTLPCMSSDPDSSYENPSQVKSGEKKAELGPRETESNTSQSDNDSKNEKESSNVVKALYSGDSTLPCMSSDPDSSYENPSQVKSGEKKAELGPRETESNTSQSDNDSKNEKESSNVVKALYSGDSTLPCMSSDPDSSYENPSQVKSGEKKAELGPRETESNTSQSDNDSKNEKESSNVVKALYSGDSTLPCMSSDPDSSYENTSQVKSGEKKAELGPRETESNTSQSDNDSKNEKESSNVVKALYSGDSTLPCMSSDPDSSYENTSQVKSGEKKAELGPRETFRNTSQSDNDSKNEKESSNVMKALYSGDSTLPCMSSDPDSSYENPSQVKSGEKKAELLPRETFRNTSQSDNDSKNEKESSNVVKALYSGDNTQSCRSSSDSIEGLTLTWSSDDHAKLHGSSADSSKILLEIPEKEHNKTLIALDFDNIPSSGGETLLGNIENNESCQADPPMKKTVKKTRKRNSEKEKVANIDEDEDSSSAQATEALSQRRVTRFQLAVMKQSFTPGARINFSLQSLNSSDNSPATPHKHETGSVKSGGDRVSTISNSSSHKKKKPASTASVESTESSRYLRSMTANRAMRQELMSLPQSPSRRKREISPSSVSETSEGKRKTHCKSKNSASLSGAAKKLYQSDSDSGSSSSKSSVVLRARSATSKRKPRRASKSSKASTSSRDSKYSAAGDMILLQPILETSNQETENFDTKHHQDKGFGKTGSKVLNTHEVEKQNTSPPSYLFSDPEHVAKPDTSSTSVESSFTFSPPHSRKQLRSTFIQKALPSSHLASTASTETKTKAVKTADSSTRDLFSSDTHSSEDSDDKKNRRVSKFSTSKSSSS